MSRGKRMAREATHNNTMTEADIATLLQALRPARRARPDAVRHASHDIGYGVVEDMDKLLAEHRVDD